MLALEGYYDRESVQTLGKIHAQKNQKLIITILDEFVEELPQKRMCILQEVCWQNTLIRI